MSLNCHISEREDVLQGFYLRLGGEYVFLFIYCTALVWGTSLQRILPLRMAENIP